MRPCLPLLCASLLGLIHAAPLRAEQAGVPEPPSLQPASVSTSPGAPAAESGAFSIVVLPDTQFYAQLHPEIFHRQTQWIADNIQRYDIRFVVQLGDITQTGATGEWNVARDAFARLTGKVPFSLAPGNHDYAGKADTEAHRSRMSEFLPVSLFKSMATYGGVYDAEPGRSDNQFHTFEAGGRKWLVVAIEYAPRSDVLRWAGEVVAKYPDRTAIVITHAYLSPKSNERFHSKAGDGSHAGAAAAGGNPPDMNQGEEIWQKFVSKHPNIAVVLCGHACYTNRRTDTGVAGNTVHEMVVDYQKDDNGGNGWLRLLQFLSDGKTVRSHEYSPTLDQTSTMPDRTFDFELGARTR
jgi:3',5'-cyclic AMP phosphodiesterase CpdA